MRANPSRDARAGSCISLKLIHDPERIVVRFEGVIPSRARFIKVTSEPWYLL
jgi:hypothetical protein